MDTNQNPIIQPPAQAHPVDTGTRKLTMALFTGDNLDSMNAKIHRTDEIPPTGAENTSGQGKLAVIPREIEGWSWGAFLLSWIWSVRSNTWIGLLSLVPFAGIIMPFILGVKGNEWAWQNKRWDSIEHFKITQARWLEQGSLVWIISFLMLVIVISVLTTAYHGIREAVF